MARIDVALDICNLAGPDVAQVVDLQNGWPAHIQVWADDAWRDVALFAAPVGLSHRNGDERERRFQNPGGNRPMEWPPHLLPMYVGLWKADPLTEVPNPVLVGAEVEKRAGSKTRASVFPNLEALRRAASSGWAEHLHGLEPVVYAWPKLLGLMAQAASEGVSIPADAIAQATEAAGVSLNDPTKTAMERVRRLGSRLVRDARFRRDVLSAYGWRCAMCGLSVGLVEAAHIYPASAPNSPDTVDNGLALCRNHHRAFDSYQIWVDPKDRKVRLHPDIIELASSDDPVAHFVSQTYSTLEVPSKGGEQPRSEYFDQRYALDVESYRWATTATGPNISSVK